MANKFKAGEIVVLRSGGPPMTVEKVPGDKQDYTSSPFTEYRCEWFKGASAQNGTFAEHVLDAYTPPAKPGATNNG